MVLRPMMRSKCIGLRRERERKREREWIEKEGEREGRPDVRPLLLLRRRHASGTKRVSVYHRVAGLSGKEAFFFSSSSPPLFYAALRACVRENCTPHILPLPFPTMYLHLSTIRPGRSYLFFLLLLLSFFLKNVSN